jgi:tRNA(adenine34) deaminase
VGTESGYDAWMQLAIDEARAAADEGEVPVGAVLLREGEVIGRGHNRTEQLDDPAAHAEILALREAGTALGDWRLEHSTLVVTLEPCPMCIGAIILARIERLVYGAADPRYGACGSAVELRTERLAPHLLETVTGVREQECGDLLRDFFRELRARKG